ncbi:SMC-Scp complex subunit ScpB [Vulcanibacillus modesticaldus]|uniref:Segregation and condensation protein B n=1 Tax=Vulcanibacillus modesticaldus TaxID=337097 RepID=A0A1D2YSI4_9BACI|nr:SMC-Scp complex subunit ScpB [Vulcanibacillus modesticaldus]OEF97247.1 SMC-Scp complex subunit ScpB [Vulcanibacillus modesticaldus]
MDYEKIKSIIEGLLFVVGDEGIDKKQLASIVGIDTETVEDVIYDMIEDYKREHRGIQIVQIVDTYQLTTLPEHAEYFERLATSPTHSSLSQAALETLAIIAYKQPITKAEIDDIRGVKSDRAIKTLINKRLIKEVGRMDAIGRPILFGTTKEFLDYFGLKNLEELPPPTEQIELEEDDEDLYLFS